MLKIIGLQRPSLPFRLALGAPGGGLCTDAQLDVLDVPSIAHHAIADGLLELPQLSSLSRVVCGDFKEPIMEADYRYVLSQGAGNGFLE